MLPCHGRKSGLSVETRIAFQVFISNSEKCKTCSRIFCVKIISQKLFGIRFFFLREINLTEILCIETNVPCWNKQKCWIGVGHCISMIYSCNSEGILLTGTGCGICLPFGSIGQIVIWGDQSQSNPILVITSFHHSFQSFGS